MRHIIKNNNYFLIPYLLIGMAALVVISLTSKSSLHMAINHFHNRFLDGLFQILTFFGNGWFACGLALLFLLVKIRYSLYMAVSYALSGLIVQLLKHLVFPQSLRPVPYLSSYELHLVQGITVLHNYSFPSGHATTAFAIFFICSHIIPSRIIKFIMLMLAILVAFSRTYLSLHFLEDVLAGSFIGTTIAIACIYLTDKIKKDWTGKSLLSLSDKEIGNGTAD